MPSVIVADQLTKWYGPRLAVDRVSLEVEAGEVMGLLGPNGSGKTTILRILAGYLRPSHAGGTSGYASITLSRSTVRYSVTLPTAALPSDLAEALRLAQMGSQQNRDKLLDVLRRQIILRANGTRCEPGPGQVVPSAFDATSFTMYLDFACGSTVRDLVVEDNIFDVLGPDHHTLAKVDAYTCAMPPSTNNSVPVM